MATITVRATDAYGNWADETFTVNVTPAPPMVTEPFDDITVGGDPSYQSIDLTDHFAGNGQDDGSQLTYKVISGGTSVVSATIVNQQLDLQFLGGQSGEQTITIEAEDSFDQTATAQLQVTVVGPPTSTRQLPGVAVFEGADSQDVSLDEYFEAQQPADGSDDNTLAYTATAANGDIVDADVNGSDLNLSFDEPGKTTITVVATDSFGQSVSQPFNVFVDATPTIASLKASASSVQIGAQFSLIAKNVNDETSDIASVAFFQTDDDSSDLDLADATLLGSGIQSGTDWTLSGVSQTTLGSETYFAIATDAMGNPSDPQQVSVTTTLPPPVIEPLPSEQVSVGSPLQLTVSASEPTDSYDDSDNIAIGYSLDPSSAFGDSLPSGASIDAGSGVFSWTPTAADVGTHYITVRATANDSSQSSSATNGSSTHTFAITVNSAQIPSISAALIPTAPDTVGESLDTATGNSWDGDLAFTWGGDEPTFPAYVDFELAITLGGTGNDSLSYSVGQITVANGSSPPPAPTVTSDGGNTATLDWNIPTPMQPDVYGVPVTVSSNGVEIVAKMLYLEVDYGQVDELWDHVDSQGLEIAAYGDYAAPTAADLSLATPSGTPLSALAISYESGMDFPLTNENDIISEPNNGTLSRNTSTGEWIYTPNPGFVGTDSFTYQTDQLFPSNHPEYDIVGGPYVSNTATVTIDVTATGQLTMISPLNVPDNLNQTPGGLIPVYSPDLNDPNTADLGWLSIDIQQPGDSYFKLATSGDGLDFYQMTGGQLSPLPDGWLDYNSGDYSTIYVAGESASQSVGDDTITLNWSNSADGSSPIELDTLALTVVQGALEVEPTDGQSDGAAAHTSQGMLLPINSAGNQPQLVPLILNELSPAKGGAYSLEFTGGITVYQDADGSQPVVGLNQYSPYGATRFATSQQTTLYVEGTSTGDASISLIWSSIPVDDSAIDNAPQAQFTLDTVNFDVVNGSLSIASPGQESPGLSGYQVVNPGGFVPVHVPGITTPAGATVSASSDQATLTLWLPPTTDAGAYYTLTFDSSQVKVWTTSTDETDDDDGDANSDDEVQSDETQFQPGTGITSQVTLYIEGISASDNLRDVSFSLNYVLPADSDSDGGGSGGSGSGGDDESGGDSGDGNQSVVVSKANLTVVQGSLTVVAPDGTTYTDQDNDPSDAYRTTPGALFQLQLGSIDPESAGGMYELNFDSSDVQVWLDPDRQQPVISGSTLLDASQLNSLYAALTGAALTDNANSDVDDGLPPLQGIQLLWTPDPVTSSGSSLDESYGGSQDVAGSWASSSSESGGGAGMPSYGGQNGPYQIGWMPVDLVKVGLEQSSLTVTATDQYAQAPPRATPGRIPRLSYSAAASSTPRAPSTSRSRSTHR